MHIEKDRQSKYNQRFRAQNSFIIHNGALCKLPRKGSNDQPRRVIPNSEAFDRIKQVHFELGHSGYKRTHKAINQRFYGITQEEVQWLINKCQYCLQNRLKRRPRSLAPPVPPRQPASARNSRPTETFVEPEVRGRSPGPAVPNSIPSPPFLEPQAPATPLPVPPSHPGSASEDPARFDSLRTETEDPEVQRRSPGPAEPNSIPSSPLSDLPTRNPSPSEIVPIPTANTATLPACKCKGKCTGRCRCKKNQVQCTIHCHADEHDCDNLATLAPRTEMALLPHNSEPQSATGSGEVQSRSPGPAEPNSIPSSPLSGLPTRNPSPSELEPIPVANTATLPTCKCKGKCTGRCRCKKNQVRCTVYCHADEHDCDNLAAHASRTEMALVPRNSKSQSTTGSGSGPLTLAEPQGSTGSYRRKRKRIATRPGGAIPLRRTRARGNA